MTQKENFKKMRNIFYDADEAEVIGETVTFARTHAFANLLRAMKDPEYECFGFGELADRIIRQVRFLGQLTPDVDRAYGSITVVYQDIETIELVKVIFIWAESEEVLNRCAYAKCAETFSDTIRPNDEGPLLRIIEMQVDDAVMGDLATGTDIEPERVKIISAGRPYERIIESSDDAEDVQSGMVVTIDVSRDDTSDPTKHVQ